MFSFWKRQRPAVNIDPATKEEILKLLSGLQESQRSRYPRLAFLLKMGTGYVAMAVFTMAALSFSAFTLYGIHNTAREIAYVDLPAISSLSKMKSSLLAQENFVGKYAILKDPTFIGLFQQRDKETIAALEVLDKTDTVQEVDLLKHLYQEYQKSCFNLFAGQATKPAEHRAAAEKFIAAVDDVSAKRQVMLQGVVNRADSLRKTTMKWTVIISCSGFVLAIAVAMIISYRVITALKRLQTATHHLAVGDFHYDPVAPVGEELSELAGDFAKIADRLKALEAGKSGAKPVVAGEDTSGKGDAG